MNRTLAPADYLVPSDQLPKAKSEPWMRHVLIWTIALTLLSTLGTAFGPMDETVAMTGEIRPAVYAYASPLNPGTLANIAVKEGDSVKAGDLLASLDTWALDRELSQLQADLTQARAEFARASAVADKVAAVPVPPDFFFSQLEVDKQRDLLAIQEDYLTRSEKLESLGAASPRDMMNLRMQLIASKALMDRYQQASDLASGTYGKAAIAEAEAQKAVAAARVTALEVREKQLEAERKRLEIRAAIDGIVTATAFIYPGAVVEPGQAIFKIAQQGEVVLRLHASEDRIASLQPGEKVRFRSRSNPDRLAPYAVATLVRITPERELTGSAPNAPKGDYLLDATVAKAPYPLPAGATVDAEVVLGSQPFYRRWFEKTR